MSELRFQLVKPSDTETIQLIANWYLSQWNIPIENTIQKLQLITTDKLQFQVLMTLDHIPIATGGMYNYVGLLEKIPRLKIYPHWLALVYTIPGNRHQGYGAQLCTYIHNHSKTVGLKNIYLFTDTAERLYARLGWTEVERLSLENRNIIIMTKEL